MLYNYTFYFLIYSFLGWSLEVCHAALNTGKFVNRGFLNGPYCPIYGFGSMAIIYFVTPFKENLLILFIASVIITSILELITGFLLEKIFGYRWWDYSNVPFNIKGYICLKFSILWGLACILLLNVIHPLVRRLIFSTPLFLGKLIMYVCVTSIIVDLIVTIKTVLNLNIKLEKLEKIAQDIHQFSNNIGDKLSTNFLANQEKFKAAKKKNWLERRLLKSFPDLRSTRYEKHLKGLMNDLYQDQEENRPSNVEGEAE